MKNIAVILGTAREGNFSQKVAELVFNHLKEKGYSTEFVNVEDFTFGKTIAYSGDKNPVKPWADIITRSEAIIFVCPEYNHSYPGELKILIDSLYDEYKGKIAGIVSVSMGQFAGVRVTEALKILLHTVNFKLVHTNVNVPKVQNEIDEQKTKKHLDSMIDEMKTLVF